MKRNHLEDMCHPWLLLIAAVVIGRHRSRLLPFLLSRFRSRLKQYQ